MGRLCSRFFPKKAGWRIFCRPDTKLVELYEWRGTSFMASGLQVMVQSFVGSTGAVAV
jgi:hypothetical protein